MPVRETFWNIPHWAEIAQYVLGLLSILVCVVGIARHVKRWRMGKPVKRTDKLGKRLWSVVKHGVGQFRTAEDTFAGVMHLSIFWGMAALVLGTALATIDWDVTHLFFDFQFLKGNVYIIYELVLDILGLVLVFGLGLAAYRRYVSRPSRLRSEAIQRFEFDDAYTLIMLGLIVVTGYLVEGLRIAVIQPSWANWSPVGNALASLFDNLRVTDNRTLHLVLWSVHGLTTFGFIVSIPFTKLIHVFTAPINIFYRSFSAPRDLAPSNQNEGVLTWNDFSWKQILEFESCVRCGRCADNCPSNSTALAFSPMNVMAKLRTHVWESRNGKSMYGDVVSLEEIWACTTCYACAEVCPVFNDFVSTVVDMRRHLVIEGQVDPELQDALASLGRYGNSFGQSPRTRARWSEPVEPKLKDARREIVDYLWFVGDYASFSPSLTTITQLTAEVFTKANLDFGILYDAEQNAGNDVRRVGEEGLFEMLAEKNLRSLGRSKFGAVVTTDPHSYNTLKHEYPSLLGETVEVLHYTELLEKVIRHGRLKF